MADQTKYVQFRSVQDWLKAYGAGPNRVALDDDIFDRLSHRLTFLILVIFTMVAAAQQVVGEKMRCWLPPNFHWSHGNYTREMCWLTNTYDIPWNESIPMQKKDREEHEIRYYQWVPLILLCMAFMFYFPKFIWRTLSGGALCMDHVMLRLVECAFSKRSERKAMLGDIADYLDGYFTSTTPYHKNCCYSKRMLLAKYTCMVCGRRYGNYFLTTSLISKYVYLANAVLVFYLLNDFLSADFSLYGLEVLRGFVSTNHESGRKMSLRFPVVTFCDIQIRHMHVVQPWTLQCVLPGNLYNEKIFIFLWFWYLFVAVLTGVGFLRAIYNFVARPRKLFFIKKHLRIRGRYPLKSENKALIRKNIIKFADEYLKQDGIFLMELAVKNGSDLLAGDILVGLWDRFMERNGVIQEKPSEPIILQSEPNDSQT
ncbi:hypothetical protein CHS0354_005774 [Potamilus streckersoni]|uniref:Innexin n=1 Tax=Potamilus streckersoni TaxID=2493646 RepID=A0AAE0SNP0_9BIVA|nr:hypothetical protein CHS0354_005774 [Potamilus streckersoni]